MLPHSTPDKVLLAFPEDHPSLAQSDIPKARLPGIEPQRNRVGYVYDSRMMAHQLLPNPEQTVDDDRHHPEQPKRIEAIDERLKEGGCLEVMVNIPTRHMRKDEALLVHSEDHWEKVAAIANLDIQAIINSRLYYEQLSLYVNSKSSEAALLSAGGVIEATLAVALGKVRTSFANVRPPGHHAEPEEHMGFCFFNNVAIAAKVAQLITPAKKIMILDWDVHHGNGTQRAFDDDPTVLYVSIHRYEGGSFYPCGPFGSMESCGEGDGLGFSVNIPWPTAGMRDADYLYAFMRIVMPVAYEFAPDLVIISAGFDAADGDDLGECHVTPAGFAHMTHMLSSLAQGRVVVALEGGYNLKSISASALAVAEVLLGMPPPMLAEQQASEIATETVWQVSRIQSRFWKSIDPGFCEPKEEYGPNAVSVADILKSHRLDYMSRFGMFTIPFVDPILAQAFDGQVICGKNFFERPQLIVFIHDYGSLRAELEGQTHIDVDVEKSYILDASVKLMHFIQDEQFALLDINVFPHKLKKTTEAQALKQLITYMWDNYVELSDATDIAIIASGYSTRAIVDILIDRPLDKLKAVVQVVGMMEPPRVKVEDQERKLWMITHTLIVMPKTHPSLQKHLVRNTAAIVRTDAERPTDSLIEIMPEVRRFIRDQFGLPDEEVDEIMANGL